MPLVMFGVKEQSYLRWLVVLRVRRSSPRRVDRIRRGPMRHDLAAPGIVLRRGRGNSLAAELPGETIAVSACSQHEERHRQACCFHRR
jgi:hypothetical protein